MPCHTTRDRRREKGLCIYCGIHPMRPDRVSCFECAIKRSEYNEQRYAEMKRMGLHPNSPGHQREWIFSVTESGREVFRGTVEETSDFVGVSGHSTVYQASRTGRLVQGIYRIARIRINENTGGANG